MSEKIVMDEESLWNSYFVDGISDWYKNPCMKNKLGITQAEKLRVAEYRLARYREVELEKNLVHSIPLGKTSLKDVHYHLFQDVYDWAGQFRTVNMIKGSSGFTNVDKLDREITELFIDVNKKVDIFKKQGSKKEVVEFLAETFNRLNKIHPFREGNGRTQRVVMTAISNQIGYKLNWPKDIAVKESAASEEINNASISGFNGDLEPLKEVFGRCLVKSIVKEISENKIKSPVDKDIYEPLKAKVEGILQQEKTKQIEKIDVEIQEKSELLKSINQSISNKKGVTNMVKSFFIKDVETEEKKTEYLHIQDELKELRKNKASLAKCDLLYFIDDAKKDPESKKTLENFDEIRNVKLSEIRKQRKANTEKKPTIKVVKARR